MRFQVYSLTLNGKRMSWFKLEVIFVMASYAALIGIFLLGRKLAKAKVQKPKSKNNLDEITVVIPFRNEGKNLPQLLKSIQGLVVKPKEFIFVNDHSEDDFLSHFSSLDFPFMLLNLNENQYGKKAAIQLGVDSSDSEFILSWDGDVIVEPEYFVELEKHNWADLNILPVYMHGPDLIPGFFAMDYQLQTQANVALSGFYRPITSSGANLLFSKKIFIEAATTRNDADIASGDDQFLLKAVRDCGKEIQILIDKLLQVKTSAPQTITDGMQQRRRWLGKSAKVRDSFASIFGLTVFLLQMTYYSFAWFQSFIGDWGATIVLILIKGELDAFLVTYAFQEQFNTLKVFFYQLVYPIYMIALLFSSFVLKSEWKGRKS